MGERWSHGPASPLFLLALLNIIVHGRRKKKGGLLESCDTVANLNTLLPPPLFLFERIFGHLVCLSNCCRSENTWMYPQIDVNINEYICLFCAGLHALICINPRCQLVLSLVHVRVSESVTVVCACTLHLQDHCWSM